LAGPALIGSVTPDPGTWHTLRLACREPLDGQALLRFLAARAVPGVEGVSRGRYARTVRVPEGWGVIELVPPPADRSGDRTGEAHVLLRARLTSLRGIGQVASRCRRLFDLDADPLAIDAALAADGTLAPLVAAHPGLRVPGAYDGFELAIRAVIGQQVSVAGASTLTGRLAARYGTRLGATGTPGATSTPGATGTTGATSTPGATSTTGATGTPRATGTTGAAGTPRGADTTGPAGALTVLFPGPSDLADADLSGLGLTTRRQVTLRTLAAACAAGRLSLDPGADPEETAARLAELPGVGPWTVAYIMLRAAGDPDAFPGSDLGLRRAMARLGCEPGHADRWRPWRAYAALHLWAALAEPAAVAEPAAPAEPAAHGEPARLAARPGPVARPAPSARPAPTARAGAQAVRPVHLDAT
jgi:AraC family transcriptional regulator, regulatory protein of adaptative response / DNA-3-methyladenine glycosylase II